ncbi:MAG: TonB family protein [Bacteroidales bacterium]
MPALTLANLVLYILHVAAVAAIGAGVPVMCGVVSPRARLFHYRLMLLLALALPLAGTTAAPITSVAPSWLRAIVHVEQGTPVAAVAGDGARAGVRDGAVPRTSAAAPWIGPAVLSFVALGFLARLAWVAVGLRLLRRLRLGSDRLEPRPAVVREAVALASADADIRLSSDVACPVNFGARRPTVLLPRVVQTYPDEEQRAITCHELIHVRRHDWLRTIGDETVRAVFWFHPAVWWLLGEIHLAREQVVDQEVVRLTGTRRPYLEALVKLARPAVRPALGPAPSFIRRAHLAQRVALLLREVRMSKTRVVGALAASTGTVFAAAALAVWTLPLQATPADSRQQRDEPVVQAAAAQSAAPAQAAQPAKQAPAVSAKPQEAGQPKLLSRADAVYPPDAKAKGIQGVVILGGRVTTTGEVTDVKILRSIPALDEAALDAARKYRFAPIPSEKDIVISIPFSLDEKRSPQWQVRTPKGAKTATTPGKAQAGGTAGGVEGGVVGGVAGGTAGGTPPPPPPRLARLLSKVEPVYPPEAKAKGIKGVVMLEALINTAGEVSGVKVLRSVFPPLDQAAVDAVKQYRFEPSSTERKVTIWLPFPPK